jgi:hypothetical protein
LFDQLSHKRQADIASSLARGVEDARSLLSTFDHASRRERTRTPITEQRSRSTFDTWRYLHEYDEADFCEGDMVKVVVALQTLVLQQQPRWDLWPGVVPTK